MDTAAQTSVDRLTAAFDWHDPDYTPDVAEAVHRELANRPGPIYSPAHGGMWILARYEHVRAALRDHDVFLSGSGVHFPRAAGMPKFAPIDFDPPEHAGIRELMAPPVQPDEVRRLEPSLRELAADLVAPLVDQGGGDLHAQLAEPFALRALGLVIGLSPEAQNEIRGLTRTLWGGLSEAADSSGFWPAYHDLLSAELRRARERPGDDYLSRLAGIRVDGQPVPDETLYSIVVSYCVAGHDNTMNSISRLLWYLSDLPQLQQRLRTEPELGPVLAEEALRRWCPTDRFTRVTSREVTVGGVPIPGGSRVVLLFDAGNRDPAVFPDPDEFRTDRGNSHRHLSFGQGIHHCLGAQLARLEFQVVLGELARHPEFRATGEPRRSFENGRHIVFDRIPVRFGRPTQEPDSQEER
ncbi:MAG TPA: cytochrome P450 [Actinocrinis sp.]|nr:cytochrome P450 [Actinocrinis sp.]